MESFPIVFRNTVSFYSITTKNPLIRSEYEIGNLYKKNVSDLPGQTYPGIKFEGTDLLKISF
ncbi:hypothetical protein DTO10_07065 [Peribacillus butanolivorans]|uniref:Uncharacterized protein n=1 Tax=Peribacillus butanolivorans TaxID=421767 RepID=A0ABN5MYG4_9BACI|nr:hypothetical protein DTO10_07065 [Peribacillus butanolivorans]